MSNQKTKIEDKEVFNAKLSEQLQRGGFTVDNVGANSETLAIRTPNVDVTVTLRDRNRDSNLLSLLYAREDQPPIVRVKNHSFEEIKTLVITLTGIELKETPLRYDYDSCWSRHDSDYYGNQYEILVQNIHSAQCAAQEEGSTVYQKQHAAFLELTLVVEMINADFPADGSLLYFSCPTVGVDYYPNTIAWSMVASNPFRIHSLAGRNAFEKEPSNIKLLKQYLRIDY